MTMDDRPDREGGAAGGMLPAAEQLLADGAGALVASIARKGGGTSRRARSGLAEIRQLRRVLLAAYQERELVEEHQTRGGDSRASGRSGNGAPDGDKSDGVLDLDAARDEIGRRLARLRAAGDAGELSGEPEP
ncbi:hypothetical protein FHY55_11155 [Oceanicola sp. D3]|uniref:hypothetical protein n=1 Tax=Oceanicola sp. D3 TaxID=2587163 RepID=UPI00111E04F8|nr:hypothetical protein [Oceanicola sp. D3]QDC09770.1 hypothetical protein FHY55_11155 [Oceanicola sp. D3]